MIKKISVLSAIILICTSVSGQMQAPASGQSEMTRRSISNSERNLLPRFAIKTNLLYDATTTINLGVEFSMGRKTTLDISGNYNPWVFSDNKKLQHYMLQPELRLWFCERFNGSFIGIHALGGEFNINRIDLPFDIFPRLNEYRHEGWFAGAGISYGYQWYLGPRWNLEATVGVGYIYADYSRYNCAKCGDKIDDMTKNYFGPTKVGLSLIYMFNFSK